MGTRRRGGGAGAGSVLAGGPEALTRRKSRATFAAGPALLFWRGPDAPPSGGRIMRDGQLNGVLRHVRSLAAAGQARELADRELLERFVSRHDEAAFAT